MHLMPPVDKRRRKCDVAGRSSHVNISRTRKKYLKNVFVQTVGLIHSHGKSIQRRSNVSWENLQTHFYTVIVATCSNASCPAHFCQKNMHKIMKLTDVMLLHNDRSAKFTATALLFISLKPFFHLAPSICLFFPTFYPPALLCSLHSRLSFNILSNFVVFSKDLSSFSPVSFQYHLSL